MIRINLLEEARGAERGPVISAPSMPEENLIFYVLQVAIVVLAALGVGGYWWWNTQRIATLNEDIARQEAELAKLKKVIELNKELQRKRDLLRRKIEVISKLKRNQDVPVRMMDQVSKNLAEFLWLDSMTVKGRTLNLSGIAQNEYAFAQFMRNLQNSPYFEDVFPDFIGEGRGRLYEWKLRVNFVLPEEKAEQDQQQRASN